MQEHRDLVSEALRSAGLLVEDPASQGVIEKVAPGAPLHRIENVYEYGPGVRCSICPQRQAHQHGITLRLGDGSLALCGRDCCARRWGKGTYERLYEELRERQKNAIFHIRVQPLLHQIERAEVLISGWTDAGRVAVLRKELQTAFPELIRALVEAGRRQNSQLFVEQLSVDPETGRRTRNRVALTSYRGYAFLHQDPRRAIVDACAALRRSAHLLKQGPTKNQEFRAIFELCQKARQHLSAAAASYNAACDFCTEESIQTIIRWTREHAPDGPKYIFQKKDRTIKRSPDELDLWGSSPEVRLPMLERITDAAEVDRLLQTS